MATFDNLPAEILTQVYLMADNSALRRVSKRMHTLSKSPFVRALYLLDKHGSRLEQIPATTRRAIGYRFFDENVLAYLDKAWRKENQKEMQSWGGGERGAESRRETSDAPGVEASASRTNAMRAGDIGETMIMIRGENIPNWLLRTPNIPLIITLLSRGASVLDQPDWIVAKACKYNQPTLLSFLLTYRTIVNSIFLASPPLDWTPLTVFLRTTYDAHVSPTHPSPTDINWDTFPAPNVKTAPGNLLSVQCLRLVAGKDMDREACLDLLLGFRGGMPDEEGAGDSQTSGRPFPTSFLSKTLKLAATNNLPASVLKKLMDAGAIPTDVKTVELIQAYAGKT